MKLQIDTSTGGMLSNSNDQVLSVEFHARSTNSGSVYAGTSTIGAGNGRELTPGEFFTLNFSAAAGMDPHAGRILLSDLYCAVEVVGDQVDWSAILK